MTIQIGKIKLVWFENVLGWIMTGIIGPDGKWFFGFSHRPQMTVNFDEGQTDSVSKAFANWIKFADGDHAVEKLYFKAIGVNKESDTAPDTWVDNLSDSNLKARTAQVASLLRSSEFYMSTANSAAIELINIFERFSYGQASLEAVNLALCNFRAESCYPVILQYFLQQPDEITNRVRKYILSLPQIEASLQKLSYINNSDLVRLEIDYCFDKPCPVCGASSDQQCSIDDPDREGFAIELGGWIHRQRIED